ncbi:hypothetical protein KKE14_02005 [Patescibacteria group bacterium]|nr:hypothetical protein [Patescibacteria group bacterium]
MKKGNFEDIEKLASRIKWVFFIFLTLALVFVVYTGFTMAQTSGDPNSLYTWVVSVRTMVSTLIGALALLMVVIGGIMYATSAGNPKQISAAKDIIVSAVSGVALYILSAVLLGSATEQGIINTLFPPSS